MGRLEEYKEQLSKVVGMQQMGAPNAPDEYNSGPKETLDSKLARIESKLDHILARLG